MVLELADYLEVMFKKETYCSCQNATFLSDSSDQFTTRWQSPGFLPQVIRAYSDKNYLVCMC